MYLESKFDDFPGVETLEAFRISSSKIPPEFKTACRENHQWLVHRKFSGIRVYFVSPPNGSQRVIMLYRHATGKLLLCAQYINDQVYGNAADLSGGFSNARWHLCGNDQQR